MGGKTATRVGEKRGHCGQPPSWRLLTVLSEGQSTTHDIWRGILVLGSWAILGGDHTALKVLLEHVGILQALQEGNKSISSGCFMFSATYVTQCQVGNSWSMNHWTPMYGWTCHTWAGGLHWGCTVGHLPSPYQNFSLLPFVWGFKALHKHPWINQLWYFKSLHVYKINCVQWISSCKIISSSHSKQQTP